MTNSRVAFAAEGIDVVTGHSVTRVEREGGDGAVTASLDDGRVFVADELLVAVGRRPATGDLGLEAVGLEPGRYITADDRLRAAGVEGEWLYRDRRLQRPRASHPHGQIPDRALRAT